MLVKVAAARREGAASTTIYDQPVGLSHTTSRSDGSLMITFVATGMYDKPSRGSIRKSSQYRYTLVLSPEEISILTKVGMSKLGNPPRQ